MSSHSIEKFHIISGATKKNIETGKLISYFKKIDFKQEGVLYTGYPIIGTKDGAFSLDALLITREHGLICFDIVEGTVLGDYKERQDTIYNKIKSYLLDYNNLTERRELAVNPVIITLATSCNISDDLDEDYVLIDDIKNLESEIKKVEWNKKEFYEKLHSAIQNVSTIRENKNRLVSKKDSRGAILKSLEDSIANLDHSQANAVINTYDGVQRIRGLAGSGKTIVLAQKVAYLHAANPDWDIAITFNTRSLKGQFRKLITRFVWEKARSEPNWDKISIIHAWGSSYSEGIYYNFCINNGIRPLAYNQVKDYANSFDYACKKALESEKAKDTTKYDIILIDEAQDFPKSFLMICYSLLKDPKRLVYAYDELQSLSGESMEPPEKIFTDIETGSSLVKNNFDDIVLYKCYRNSKEVLTTAHAFGFGIYRNKGLVQMFENYKIWEDIGYKVTDGELEKGKDLKLERDNDTSPDFLDNLLKPKNDKITIMKLNDDNQQVDYIVNDIVNNIQNEELNPNDIIVINFNPITTAKNYAVNVSRQQLFEKKINSIIAGISSNPDIFNQEDTVTFTGIYRAKGNEAGMVYIINAQDFNPDSVKDRNILFTAMTRSKAWVRIVGFGNNMDNIIDEYSKIKDNQFKLSFKYPTDEEMKKMTLLNREQDKTIQKKVSIETKGVESFIKSIKSGNLLVDDFSPEIFEELKKIILKDK